MKRHGIIADDIDPYLIHARMVSRVYQEWKEHGKIIVAFDFDDTVFDTHEHGWSYDMVIDLLREIRPYAYIICWSASSVDRYPDMWEYFESEGIPCDAINESAPWIERRGAKIYANIYLDDRSGLLQSYVALRDVLKLIKEDIKNGSTLPQ